MTEVAESASPQSDAGGALFTAGAVLAGLLVLAPLATGALNVSRQAPSPVIGVVLGVALAAGVMALVSWTRRASEVGRVALLVVVGTATLLCGLRVVDLLDSTRPGGLVVAVPLVVAGLAVAVSAIRLGPPSAATAEPLGRGPLAAGLALGLIFAVPTIVLGEGLEDLGPAVPGVLLVVSLLVVLLVGRGHRVAAVAAGLIAVVAAVRPLMALLAPVLGERSRFAPQQLLPIALFAGVVVVAIVVAADAWRAGRTRTS